MPRSAYVFAAIALCVGACEQQAPAASGSSAAPAAAAAATSAQSQIPPGFTGAPYAASRTYFKLQGRYPAAWLLCDGVDRPEIIVVGLPGADHRVATFSLDKATGAHRSQSLKVGDPDPGAGNVYWPLTRADGSDAGYLRAFNPGALDDPKAATTATFTSIKLGEDITSCRWRPNVRLLAAGARRSYQIATEGGQLVYRTFDYAGATAAKPIEGGAGMTSAPSLEVRGGQETPTAIGRLFVFENLGYRYAVEIGDAPDPHGAITVTHDGRQVAAEPFEAYTFAPARG